MPPSGAPPKPAPRICKRFVSASGRAVHYRVAGDGAAIILLHDSPRSSRLHVDTMRHLAQRFRVYALDTAGYGNSAPLEGDTLTIADFARALGEAIAALGLAGAPLYATHTSAKIALHYAAHFGAPRLLVLDGLSIPIRAPNEGFIARYMRSFRADASGAYLAAEWTRIRDTLRWFPWFEPRLDTRMPIATPADSWIEAYALDLFSAGCHYADAYAAAMRYDPLPALRLVAVPTVVAARTSDVLYASLDRVPLDRDVVTVERLEADSQAWLLWLETTLAASETPFVSALDPATERHGPCYVDLPHGQMIVHRAGPAGEQPLLILGAPTTLHALAWQRAFMVVRETIVPELPGYGESDPLEIESLAGHTDALAAMLPALGVKGGIDLLGLGFATALAVAFAVRHPKLVKRLVLDGATMPGAAQVESLRAELCPAFAMKRSGSHLFDIWHMLRDSEVQWPWYDGSVAAQRRVASVLEPEALHQALLDVLKQPGYGAAAHAGLSAPIRYAELEQPVVLFDMPGDPAYRRTPEIAALIRSVRVLQRPADIAGAAAMLAGDPAETA